MSTLTREERLDALAREYGDPVPLERVLALIDQLADATNAAASAREHLDRMAKERDEARAMFEQAAEHIRQIETEQANLVVREMASAAFVSRDLAQRAFEAIGDERRGPLGRVRVLLAEALGV